MSFQQLKAEVIDQGLCTRCGMCVGVCPEAILLCNGRDYPYEIPGCTDCGLCNRACGGAGVDFDFWNERRFRRRPGPDEHQGLYRDIYLAHAADPDVRRAGSSGGVVTQLLLDLLRRGEIDGAVVAGIDPERPWRSRAVLARTEAELKGAASSRYSVVPVDAAFAGLRSARGRWAMVGLACQIHSLRRLEQGADWSGPTIDPVIGVYCLGTLEHAAAEELLRLRRIPIARVQRFEYRGGDEWPGKMRVQLRDGRWRALHRGDYKDGALNGMKLLYTPERCHLCSDGAAELSDLTAADPWILDEDGRYLVGKDGGWTMCIVRSRGAEALLERAVAEGVLVRRRVDPGIYFSVLGPALARKRRLVSLRLEGRRRRGAAVPLYVGQLPGPTGADRRRARLLEACACLGRHPWTRALALRILFARAADSLKNAWARRKRKRYTARRAGRGIAGPG